MHFASTLAVLPNLIVPCEMQEWPQDALEAVARKFLKDMPLQKQIQNKLVSLCHAIHCKVSLGPSKKC